MDKHNTGWVVAEMFTLFKDNILMLYIYHGRLSYHSLEESVAYGFLEAIGMEAGETVSHFFRPQLCLFFLSLYRGNAYMHC